MLPVAAASNEYRTSTGRSSARRGGHTIPASSALEPAKAQACAVRRSQLSYTDHRWEIPSEMNSAHLSCGHHVASCALSLITLLKNFVFGARPVADFCSDFRPEPNLLVMLGAAHVSTSLIIVPILSFRLRTALTAAFRSVASSMHWSAAQVWRASCAAAGMLGRNRGCSRAACSQVATTRAARRNSHSRRTAWSSRLSRARSRDADLLRDILCMSSSLAALCLRCSDS